MSSADLYRFTIVDGSITEVYEYSDGIWELDPIESNESYSLDGTNVIRTENYGAYSETDSFSDPEGDGDYVEVSSSSPYDDSYVDESMSSGEDDDYSSSHDEYDREEYGGGYLSDRYVVEVNEASGAVVAFYEVESDGTLENEMESDATYEIIGGVLYETEVEDYGTEVKTYADTDGDGYWVKTSSQYTSDGSGEGGYRLSERLESEGSDYDDYLLMTELGGISGGAGADSYVMRELVNCKVLDFDADDGDKLVFDTGYGISGVNELASYLSSSSYDEASLTLLVNFSGYASLEIVGIRQDQISWEICEVLS